MLSPSPTLRAIDIRRLVLAGDVPQLGHAEVHVWRVALAPCLEHTRELAELLEVHELQRAARFRRLDDAAAFTARRAFLRLILSHYVGGDPTHLRFTRRCHRCGGAHGKPRLVGADVCFSLSQAGSSLAVYAVSTMSEIGVDVERVEAGFRWEEIAHAVLTPGELASISEQPANRRTRAFFQFWTRKEAIGKLTGDGLASAFEGIDTRRHAWGPARVEDLAVPDAYAGALAFNTTVRVSGFQIDKGEAGFLVVPMTAPLVDPRTEGRKEEHEHERNS